MKTKNCNLFKNGLCVSKMNPQPLENFFEAKGVKDGRGSRCKACIKAIAHERRLEKGNGKLRVPRRPPSIPVLEKNCSKFKKGECASPINPQPITNFRPQKGRINGMSICKSCEKKYTDENRDVAAARTRKWHRDNKEYKKDKNLIKLYGIDLAKYNEMLLSQNGRCMICKRHQNEFKDPLNVDHCHTTNNVRALLCCNCNRGLGYFKESEQNFLSAIEYIKRFKT